MKDIMKLHFLENPLTPRDTIIVNKALGESRKAGIKEVVDWLEEVAKNRRRTTKHRVNYITISHKTWQAKLKEWGINP